MPDHGRRSVPLPLWARCALGAYPSWWRERYGEDQEAFLEELAEDHRRLGRAVIDLAVGALRVRLSPAGMPPSVEAWRDRARGFDRVGDGAGPGRSPAGRRDRDSTRSGAPFRRGRTRP